ncbi:MAG: sugar-binding protein [Lentisphaeria bacterium]
MKKVIVSIVLLFCCAYLGANNLLRHGSFDGDASIAEFRTNGGKFSLFTEELTWNRCGKLEIDRVYESADETKHAASVWIGADGKLPGFPVKPETKYQFSIEIRGEVAGSASISAVCWHGDDIWKDYKAINSSLGGFQVQKDWTVYKGSFTTRPDAKRAALNLQIWESSKHGPLKYKVGDYILFDNVEISEETRSLTASDNIQSKAEIPLLKAARTETFDEKLQIDGQLQEAAWQQAAEFSDFLVLGQATPAGAKTSFKLLSDQENLYLGIRCLEPDTISAKETGNNTNIWKDDVVEIFFGAVSDDRHLSQFVISAGGGRFMGYGNESQLPLDYAAWEGKTSSGPGFWQAELRLPLRLLSASGNFPPGAMLPFNIARQRRHNKELSTWSPLKESFHEVDNYGKLVFVDFNAALQALTGKTELQVKSAEDFALSLQSLAQKQQDEKYAAVAQRQFSVALVSPTSNFAIPFIPEEIFQPATEITISAAINELKGVPIALANLTDQAAEYQVILETCGKYNGEYGLLNFPKNQFVMRQAVRFKDSDQDAGSLRLDPLPKMNQASTLMVLPKEAGLIWLDFDTSGVAPGKYQGRLRVIPLSEPAKWETINGAYWNRKYTGAMQDIPFTLEVRDLVLNREPSLPMGFFQDADNEQCFQLMLQVGTRNIGLSPWSFSFPVKDGKLIPDQVSEGLLGIDKTVRQHEEWAKKYGVTLTYFIGFSAYHAFEQVYGVSKKPELKKQLWPQWIKALNAYMNSLGVGPERYVIETWDEPHPDKFPELLESHQLAKAADPKVRLTLTLGAHIMSAQQMEGLAALTDEWTLWSDGYFKKAEHLQLIKKLQQRGVRIRHYTCDTSMRSSLARRYRRNNWFGDYHQLNGNEMFHFADTYGGSGASDWKVCTGGGIVYKLFDEYLPSIRYMALRQGMTDIKYLDKLRQLSKGNPEAEAFLSEAARRVVVDFGHDPKMPDQVREEAAMLIMKIQQKQTKTEN